MKNNLIAIIVALAVIIAAWIGGNAYKAKFRDNRLIVVTGLAEKEFTSDKVIWSGNYERKSSDQKEAYTNIKADEQQIREYLQQKGVDAKEISFSAINIDKDYKEQYDNAGRTNKVFNGYVLKQSVTIISKDIAKIEVVSKEVTELISRGIEMNSSEPAYYYTKLADVKMELLAKATADAKQRAEAIAKNSGQSLGGLRRASMGVFQITGRDSNEDFSYGGVFNTSDNEKKASITMRVEYYVK